LEGDAEGDVEGARVEWGARLRLGGEAIEECSQVVDHNEPAQGRQGKWAEMEGLEEVQEELCMRLEGGLSRGGRACHVRRRRAC
jgi:hypothetical protein